MVYPRMYQERKHDTSVRILMINIIITSKSCCKVFSIDYTLY